MPVAMPFPMANAVVARCRRAAAPPATPPVAPPRPIDELESLTSQPAPRRRFFRRPENVDYTKEIITGSVVTAVGVLLLIVYAAVRSQDPSSSERGLGGVVPDKPVEKAVVLRKLAVEHRLKEKEIEKEKKEKDSEKEKQAADAHAPDAHAPDGGAKALCGRSASPAGVRKRPMARILPSRLPTWP